MLEMPIKGKSTIGSTDVTPKGTASVIHQTNIHAAAASTDAADSGRPENDAINHTIKAIIGPKKRRKN
jgi:hypothetical protein